MGDNEAIRERVLLRKQLDQAIRDVLNAGTVPVVQMWIEESIERWIEDAYEDAHNDA